MSLRDDWKNAGKGLGKSFAEMGVSIVKSVQVGMDKADGKEPPQDTGLRESWKEVGHSFGETGKSLGKAAAGTVRKVEQQVNEHRENVPPDPPESND